MQNIILKFREIAIIINKGTFSPYLSFFTQFSSNDMQNKPDNKTKVEKMYKKGFFLSISSVLSKLDI